VTFHGAHNKHELMFVRLDPGTGGAAISA